MQDIQISITNILGQVVWSANSGQSSEGLPFLFLGEGRGEVKIDLKSNPAGIYNLQLYNDKSIINKKIIIK